ncbi:MAG: MarR family transcriptional regulator, partial [Bacteroidota bacterium]
QTSCKTIPEHAIREKYAACITNFITFDFTDMKREETIDYNVKALWHAISRMYNQFGSAYDITASTGFVLLNIDVEEGTPATKIAPLLGMESRSLTRMLNTMEEKDWVYREKDSTDGRSVRIFLTPKGKVKRELSRRAVKTFNQKIQEILPKEELQNFFKSLDSIAEIVNDPTLFQKVYENISDDFAFAGEAINNH